MPASATKDLSWASTRTGPSGQDHPRANSSDPASRATNPPEERSWHGATIAHDMNEQRIREDFAQEPDTGPASDFDQQSLPGAREVLRSAWRSFAWPPLYVGRHEIATGTAKARVERIPVSIRLAGVGIPRDPGSELRIVQLHASGCG